MDNRVLLIIVFFVVLIVIFRFLEIKSRKRRTKYYRNEYLMSDDWRRKRYIVLKRDNWRCVYCGQPATQVHHNKYLRRNIGKEPIKWLVSVCKPCHESIHKIRNPTILRDDEIKWNYGFDKNTIHFRD